ncbi:c-type cytochrome [Thermopirellula anaerolimosa]
MKSKLGTTFSDWLEDRIAWRSLVTASCGGGCDAYGRCWWPMGLTVLFFLLCLQAITGLAMWFFYSPSSQTAWESVYYIQHQLTLGWLVRGIHFWSAQVLVGFLIVYVLGFIFLRKYAPPREFVFWTALILLGLSLAGCLTGDLLSWDDEAYAATQTRVSFLLLLPKIGGTLYRLVVGGPSFGHHTLTHFFAMHVVCSAGTLILIAVIHAALARRAGRRVEEMPDRYRGAKPDLRLPVVLQGGVCLVTMIVVLAFVFLPGALDPAAWKAPSHHFGVELGAPADTDPANFYAAARPEWSFRGLYGFANLFPGEIKVLAIFVIPGITALLFFAMPIFGRAMGGHVWNVAFTLIIFGGLAYFSYQSWRHDWHDAEFAASKQAARRDAERTLTLIRYNGGIPPAGALALLRADPKTQGPRLFEQQCASCHSLGVSGQDGAILCDNPSAPNLARFASREWLEGLFDPERIGSEQYFGNTRFAAGAMVRYVEERFQQLPEEDRKAVIAALAAEADLPYEPAPESDRDLIARGRELIASQECARCHRFHGAGPEGAAPDLTGYGSREWLIGILASPQHVAFYGLRNDRMPAYVEDPARPEANRIPTEQLAILADFLRQDWVEISPSAPGDESPQPAKESVMLTLGKWQARAKPLPPRPTGDKQAEARWLYQKELCSVCHAHTAEGDDNLAAVSPTAPDLGGFASRAWIAGLLDPKQIATPKYFGNSAFVEGSMAEFVRGNLRELIDDIGQEEFDKLIDALAAEALKEYAPGEEPPTPDEDTLLLFEDFTCTDCHKFYDRGELGTAPDLTGYGSRTWLSEFIANPKNERFYPSSNDGMPSYHAFAESAKNLLTKEEIDVLADWLLGKARSESGKKSQE